jgi:hypothetical protein
MRKALCENEGLKTEGIFRLAGEHSVVSRLKAQLNNGTFSGSNDPASVASLIKVKLKRVFFSSFFRKKVSFFRNYDIDLVSRIATTNSQYSTQ